MNKPLVSIITPSYNRGHLIDDTIKSVLEQTYSNIEYIVVDGLSADNTIEILERYQEEGQLTYVSEKDEGMYYAINKGIEMAQGDIIAYLNSDDRYFPWTVQKAVDEFQEHSSVDMVFGDSFVVDVPSNETHLNIYATFKKIWLPLGGIVCQPTVFLRRRVFEEVGYFDTTFKYLADCEFWQRINNADSMKICKIDEVMAMEYNHAGTIRQTFQEGIEIEKKRIISMYRKEYPGKKLKLFTLWLYKEIKLWQIILIDRTKKIRRCQSWSNYLGSYDFEFDLLHYLLRKPYQLISFLRRALKGESMI